MYRVVGKIFVGIVIEILWTVEDHVCMVTTCGIHSVILLDSYNSITISLYDL